MKRLLFIGAIFAILISSTTLGFHSYALNSKLETYRELKENINLDLESLGNLEKNTSRPKKLKDFKNIYILSKRDVDPYKHLELLIIPMIDNKDLSASDILKSFIAKYVTTEFPFEVTTENNGSIETSYTSFSIFSDGEHRSGERYGIVKKNKKYIILIQGYINPFEGNNVFQHEFFKSISKGINFNSNNNEEVFYNL